MCYLLNSSVYLNGQNYLCIEVQNVLRMADCWSTGYKLYALLKKKTNPQARFVAVVHFLVICV